MHQVVQLPLQLQVDIQQSSQRTIISSVLIHRDLALVGTSTGILFKYRLDSSPNSAALDTFRFASEKPIEALLVVHDLVFCLCYVASSSTLSSGTDSIVCVVDLETFELKRMLERTRSATCFSSIQSIEQFAVAVGLESSSLSSPRRDWDTNLPPAGTPESTSTSHSRNPSGNLRSTPRLITKNPGENSSSRPVAQQPEGVASVQEVIQVPAMFTKVAVATRKRLVLFMWKDQEFLESFEWPLADRPRAMEWSDSMNLCIGYAKEYVMMDVRSGTTKTALSLLTQPSSLASSNSSLNNNAPVITAFPNGSEVLVSKENLSIFLGPDGRPTRSYALNWSSPPEQIAYNYPYIYALLQSTTSTGSFSSTNPDHSPHTARASLAQLLPGGGGGGLRSGSRNMIIEIRNIETQSLAQLIELPGNQGCKLLASSSKCRGPVFAASDKRLFKLTPTPFIDQVDQLTDQCQFDEAISILSQVDSIPADEKNAKLIKVQMIQALFLFQYERDYEKSMEILAKINASPGELALSLFPSFLSEHLQKSFNLYSTTASPPQTSPIGSSETIATFTTNKRQTTSSSLLANLLKAFSRSQTPLEGRDYERSVAAFARYLTEQRLNLMRRQSETQTTAADTAAEIEQQWAIIDTLLLKAYLISNDALIGPLLRVNNKCDIEETEQLLTRHKKWNELVDFYHGKRMHRKALILLSGKPASASAEQCVLYLKKILQEEKDVLVELVMEFSEPLLKSNPDLAIQIFVNDHTDVKFSHATRERVLNHLEKINQDLAERYLEHLINDRQDMSAEFHYRLIYLYLTKVLQSKEWKQYEKQQHYRFVGDQSRQKLLRFLEQSTCYRADRLLSRFPENGLFEERAILLSRMGQHDQVLNIYINRLEDESMAEAYCGRLWRELPLNAAQSIYLNLLRLYLAAGANAEGSGVNHGTFNLPDRVVRLLSSSGERFLLSAVLSALPKSTAVNCLLPFFRKSLDSMANQSAQAALQVSLLRSVVDQNRLRYNQLARQRLYVTNESVCRVCNKKIGEESVFLSLGPLPTPPLTTPGDPDEGSSRSRPYLIHYACRKRYVGPLMSQD